MNVFVGAALLATIVQTAAAQKESALSPRIDLVLEKKDGNSVRAMEPTHVFAEGDLIRFRLRSGVNGFLYVLNRGSSGKYEQLFPRSGDSVDKSVKSGTQYVIPDSNSGWFRIQAPPGYEIVYFVVSPIDLGRSLPSGVQGTATQEEQKEAADAFATATPRCDDDLFRARGECLDGAAGLKPIQKGEPLPGKLSQVPAMTSRDLVVVKESTDTSVSSTEPFDAPVIYHFKIAHK